MNLYIDAVLLVDALAGEFANAVLQLKFRRAMRIAHILRKATKRLQRRRRNAK